jgi:hypothetical protein
MDEGEMLISAAFDPQFAERAARLVAAGMAELAKGYPAVARIDAQRRARADRVLRALPDRGMAEAIVAEWLSSREGIGTASSIDAKGAAKDAIRIAQEVEALHARFAALVAALRYADMGEGGEDARDHAMIAASSIAEAARAMREAEAGVATMLEHLPARSPGRAGLVGALRDLSPEDALACGLGRLWLGIGLTLAGGEAGDGLDVLLIEIMEGDRKKAEAALSVARARLSSKIDPEKSPENS